MNSRRILAIDGGGTRGVIALAFLERLERHLAARHGRHVPLCEHFDLIGGTSTGAIIATGLALAQPLETIRDRYFSLGPKVFRAAWHRARFVRAMFSSALLQQEFFDAVGDRRLDSTDLKTGLAIFAKRIDTGSVWILTNNPNGKFWDDPSGGSFIGNRNYRLVDLLRASTAAPTYFDPLDFDINPGGIPGRFVDGGVSPYNNPALALFMVATIPAYGYSWPTGADILDITSVGTGSYRYKLRRSVLNSRISGLFGVECLQSTLSDNAVHTLTVMQALGRNETRWWMNSEIGDLSDVSIAHEPLFTFRRYDIILEKEWLESELDLTIEEPELDGWRQLAGVDAMKRLYAAAARAAERQIAL